MVCKFRLRILLVACAISAASLIAGCSKMCVNSKELKVTNSKNRIRLEHVAAPVNMRFISDAGENMMLEIYRNPPDAVPDYASMDPLLLHIAFMVDDVKDIRDKLIAAGATPVGDISVTPGGDEIAILRDPWGVAIQFVKRAEPMLPAE